MSWGREDFLYQGLISSFCISSISIAYASFTLTYVVGIIASFTFAGTTTPAVSCAKIAGISTSITNEVLTCDVWAGSAEEKEMGSCWSGGRNARW